MLKNTPLIDILFQFQEKGYRLADSEVAAMTDDDIQSNDWRLDKVIQVRNLQHIDTPVVVMAVSSAGRNMKLLFVEVLYPGTEFTPIQLLRRLFPTKNRQTARPALLH